MASDEGNPNGNNDSKTANQQARAQGGSAGSSSIPQQGASQIRPNPQQEPQRFSGGAQGSSRFNVEDPAMLRRQIVAYLGELSQDTLEMQRQKNATPKT